MCVLLELNHPPTSPQATVESLSARLATLETTASHEASAAAVKEAHRVGSVARDQGQYH